MSGHPPSSGERLKAEEYRQDPITLARRLIGRRIVCQRNGRRVSGIIVETEAYIGSMDRASHAFGGRRTPRNESMYLDGGHAYVYVSYGMHDMFNIVCGETDEPVAVLVRALEPEEGVSTMRRRRSRRPRKTKLRDTELCGGPGRLCQALAIDRRVDGVDLRTDQRIWIEEGDGPAPDGELVQSARIGVENCGDWATAPLRWQLRGSGYVSRPPQLSMTPLEEIAGFEVFLSNTARDRV